MERFNVPIPYGEDFPLVIRAQRNGEDFQTEYVEYAPRWNVDKRRQVVIADKRMFFALTDTVDRLQEYGAKVTELARWMYQVMDESCAVHYLRTLPLRGRTRCSLSMMRKSSAGVTRVKSLNGEAAPNGRSRLCE